MSGEGALLSPGVNPGVAGFEDEELSSLPSSDEPRLASYTAPMIETQEKLSPAWIDKMARDQERLRKGEYEGHVRDVPKWALTQVALIVRDAIHGRRLSMFMTPRSAWWYERYHSSWYGVLYSAVIVAICLLPLWEHPSSLRNFPSENTDVCNDSITERPYRPDVTRSAPKHLLGLFSNSQHTSFCLNFSNCNY